MRLTGGIDRVTILYFVFQLFWLIKLYIKQYDTDVNVN